MNLIHDNWIPVERRSGPDLIPPWRITDAEDPVLRLSAPRADFNGALLQFLIGLMQTTFAPGNHEQWVARLERPPSPDRLREEFEAVANAFKLDGANPRFLQDHAPLNGDPKPIANLLIDAPGAQTLAQNADHFVKRGGVEAICPSCVAIALYTLQTNAPSGGAGHRTSLRGGGPLTSLVTLDPIGSKLPDDLWRAVWLNILVGSDIASLPGGGVVEDWARVFPWLAPTRTSEPKTGRDTTPDDGHPLQMYWGMPRRIRIDWDSAGVGVCDICGATSERLVRNYVTQNYGVNYTGAWQHPLSPYYPDSGGQALPRHPQPGGIRYRHWLALTSGSDRDIPALVVRVFAGLGSYRKLPEEQLRLLAFGYDMDNMKARCWYEATFPLLLIDETVKPTFLVRSQSMVEAASETANRTRNCIKSAWFKRPKDARGDTDFLIEDFFEHTEPVFFERLKAMRTDLRAGSDGRDTLHEWHGDLCRAAFRMFDYWADREDYETADPRRIVTARRHLRAWLYGRSKALPATLEIQLEPEKVE